MNKQKQHTVRSLLIPAGAALALLALFTGWNRYLANPSRQQDARGNIVARELIPDLPGMTSRRLEFHEFETGSAGDPALRLAPIGHGGKQSFRMSPEAPFSPGLWIRFRDLHPGDSSWIRATGYVWFEDPPEKVNCWLVITCNRGGVNFKYIYLDLASAGLKPGRWNRVSLDYRIPSIAKLNDVLQAYFWYRGGGEVLVDDFEIELISNNNHLGT